MSHALNTVTSYLLGKYSECENVNAHFNLPGWLHSDVLILLDEAATQVTPVDAGDFERFGKWHNAASILMRQLDSHARLITSKNHNYDPYGLPWGDAMHRAIMNVQRNKHGIETI